MTAHPGQTQEITVYITPPTGVDPSILPVLSGFVQVESPTKTFHVTYLGVAAALKNAQVVDTTDTFFGVNIPVITDPAGGLESIIFDLTISIQDDPADGFRAFVRVVDLSHRPALRALRGFALEELNTAFVSGECVSPDSADAQAGAGVWFGRGHTNNDAFRIPGPRNQCRTVAEFAAVEEAVRRTPGFASLQIMSDSKYMVNSLTRDLLEWELDRYEAC